VNDLERDLREVLHEDARHVATPTSAPEGLRRLARRRQVVFVGLVGLAGAAVVAGIVAGATTLLPLQRGPEPAVPGTTTTSTLNGITIAYPQSWHLIDPDTAGLNGSPQMSESPIPRIVLALASTEAPETFGCPGRANGGEAAAFLMTLQEEPIALHGAAATPWPVALEPLNVDASESACYPGWEFLRAGWTASGRTFEARVGLAPEASGEERDALFTAFASMTFEPSGGAATSVVLTHGTAGGEDWQLVASRAKRGLSLEITGKMMGAGVGFTPSPDIQVSDILFGSGAEAERVVFGAVPESVVRVEATTADGSTVSAADVLDVPNEIDPNLNAFVLVVDPNENVGFRGFDASGRQVASAGRVTIDLQPPVDATLENGRHFGYVRSVEPDAGTIEFDLAYFLSGPEANDAYHAAGGTGPVPNDHFVVNDNPMLRTLTLAPDVRLRLLDWNHCCETFFDGDLSLFAQAIAQLADVTDGDLIYRGQSQWWIRVENGVVTEIEEQYSP
jgi:hypothetical protein